MENNKLENHELMESLIDEYGTDLKRLAYMYIKDHALAEDILQDVFVSCYKNINNFRMESSYKTWLVKITINKCKDTLKRWSFRNLIFKEKVSSININQTTPEHVLIENEEDILLYEQVMKLPIQFREVIILFYYEELHIEEISSLLGVKVNTVKTRLHRARQKLKEMLKGSGMHG
ncbi:sigma-70 family RNA polymerase sigma factor [Bacillus alkalisoli]|uniref:sigma-70 family RNA polymerase sigma factor n=1 Tax=Bacillus alkalisoli TaxID=2011008 RepID=UPI000C24627C|nr:sigma-70 family RNA polymerase sigma factor [Bacillus alkalisoli]